MLSCGLVRNMMELSSISTFCCGIAVPYSYKQCYFGGGEWAPIPTQIISSVELKQY